MVMNSSSEAYFFQLATDLLCVIELDGTFQRVNPAFEQALGYTSAEVQNQSLCKFVHPDDYEITQRKLTQLKTAQIENNEVEVGITAKMAPGNN